MFIKIKRTQVCTSGHYVSGVTYEIDPENHLQVRDAEHLVKREFAVEVSDPKANKTAAAKKKPSSAAASDATKGDGEAKGAEGDTKQSGA